MEQMTLKQKNAVMRVLLDVVLADGIEDEREKKFFNLIADIMELDKSVYDTVKQQSTLAALLEIDGLLQEQKLAVAQLMGKMIVADEEIHPKEVEIYNAVRHFCHIDMPLADAIESDPISELVDEDAFGLCYDDKPF